MRWLVQVNFAEIDHAIATTDLDPADRPEPANAPSPSESEASIVETQQTEEAPNFDTMIFSGNVIIRCPNRPCPQSFADRSMRRHLNKCLRNNN